MTVTRTHDLELVRSIVTHPKVYPHVTDDFSPSVEDYKPLDVDGAWYLLVYDGEELLGLFGLIAQSPIIWEVHTCLLPHAWGARAVEAARTAARWTFEHSEAQRIMTHVRDGNRLAYRFALRVGMKEYGRHPQSSLKDGALHDQILLGLSRGDLCQ